MASKAPRKASINKTREQLALRKGKALLPAQSKKQNPAVQTIPPSSILELEVSISELYASVETQAPQAPYDLNTFGSFDSEHDVLISFDYLGQVFAGTPISFQVSSFEVDHPQEQPRHD
ncbi:hypothetical protein ACH5RR_039340 [Cinchona calisaya]|uniref:Uncharacterized protein n=1 Tax=Cinchona calisaya TaxID=153742 RepID=A0ABD2XXY3_9GENT